MTVDLRPWCDAPTNAQTFGTSFASTTWSCPFHATWVVDGVNMCGIHKNTHARMAQGRDYKFTIERLK
jgi:hypothetical protein